MRFFYGFSVTSCLPCVFWYMFYNVDTEIDVKLWGDGEFFFWESPLSIYQKCLQDVVNFSVER